jgi:hypothetical protein
MRYSFDPPLEVLVVKLVDDITVRQAENLIAGCEVCSDDACLTFDYVLDAVTGEDPKVTDYIMLNAASCPRCRHEIREKSLVEPD